MHEQGFYYWFGKDQTFEAKYDEMIQVLQTQLYLATLRKITFVSFLPIFFQISVVKQSGVYSAESNILSYLENDNTQ